MKAWRHVALAALNSQPLANAPEVTSRARIEVDVDIVTRRHASFEPLKF